MSSRTNEWLPTTLSFSSGGVRTLAHMGVLMRLIEHRITTSVRAWHGCSGGSFCAFLGALGVSSAWIQDCTKVFDTRPLLTPQVLDFLEKWGLSSGLELTEYLGKFIDTWEPGASSWTFADLQRERPGIFLGITAVNLNQRKLVQFSVDTHPTMLILDAIRASSSIPFIYSPWIDASGEIFCDGALIEQAPWFHIQDRKGTLVVACDRSQVMGVSKKGTSIETFFEYCSRILLLQRKRLVAERPRFWIATNNKTVASLNFEASLEDRQQLFTEGAAAATAWIRFKHFAARTGEIPPDSVGRNTLSVKNPSVEPESGNPQFGIQPPDPVASQDLHTRRIRTSRRWSV